MIVLKSFLTLIIAFIFMKGFMNETPKNWELENIFVWIFIESIGQALNFKRFLSDPIWIKVLVLLVLKELKMLKTWVLWRRSNLGPTFVIICSYSTGLQPKRIKIDDCFVGLDICWKTNPLIVWTSSISPNFFRVSPKEGTFYLFLFLIIWIQPRKKKRPFQ